jgi:hypothetical protein
MTKRFPDWYKLQKDVQGWDSISPDMLLANRLAQCSLTINFDYCHYGLKNILKDFECPVNQRPDFYIITDIELSKKSLSELFGLYQECYEKSKVGIYIAALSYYLEPDQVFDNLTESYSKNIDTVFREHLRFAHTIEDWSTVIDYPVEVANKEGIFREGSNYIFVHPNVKYFLWKTTEYSQ